MDFAITTIKKINMNKQKFMHYAFQVVITTFGTSVAGLIVYTIVYLKY